MWNGEGPGGREVVLKIDEEWLGLSTGLPVPLYVGKTVSSIRKRVGQHLMLGSQRILPLGWVTLEQTAGGMGAMRWTR